MILKKKIVEEKQLVNFEIDIANCFNNAKIRSPIHLHGNNEKQLINIFKDIKAKDWVFSSWRSHYHCLLKGVPPDVLKKDILEGKSINLIYPEYKIYSSAIVGGIIPIALGTALGLKKNNSNEQVFLFLGEMTSETGTAHEAHKYATSFDLPITFILEINHKSVCTNTLKTWNMKNYSLIGKSKVIHYEYELPWPHAGAGVRVQF